MNMPDILKGESLTRLLQGTAIGAIAAMIIGFNWGGWTLGSTAEKMAATGAKSAVVAVLAPICVEKFQGSTEVVANLQELKDKSSYQRTGYVEKGGWATFPGSDKASDGVAKACALMLSELK